MKGKIIDITSLMFESNDPNVLIKGTVSKGHMAFETEMIISHTQLNHLVNQLIKQNSELEINDLLIAEKMYNNEMLYTASFSKITNNKVTIGSILHNQPVREIRA